MITGWRSSSSKTRDFAFVFVATPQVIETIYRDAFSCFCYCSVGAYSSLRSAAGSWSNASGHAGINRSFSGSGSTHHSVSDCGHVLSFAFSDRGAFREDRSNVEPDDVVCIIEAMKLMNEIQAEAAGEVVKIYVENGQPVEYGQPLFGIRVKPQRSTKGTKSICAFCAFLRRYGF